MGGGLISMYLVNFCLFYHFIAVPPLQFAVAILFCLVKFRKMIDPGRSHIGLFIIHEFWSINFAVEAFLKNFAVGKYC